MDVNVALIAYLRHSQAVGVEIAIALVIMLVLFAKTIADSKNPSECAHAVFLYFMQGVAVLLMSIAALPTAMAALEAREFDPITYVSLIIVFATGGILFLWNDEQLRELDPANAEVPRLVFFYAVRGVGYIALLTSILYVALMIAMKREDFIYGAWLITPVSLIMYGGIITWATSEEGHAFLMNKESKKKPAKPKKAKKKKK